jgi:PKD repeat protein
MQCVRRHPPTHYVHKTRCVDRAVPRSIVCERYWVALLLCSLLFPLVAFLSTVASAQTPPPAYFEATGSYDTYTATGNGSIDYGDCAGVQFCNAAGCFYCGGHPPWTANSGSGGISIGGTGRSTAISFGPASATGTLEGRYELVDARITDPYETWHSERDQSGTISVYVLGPSGTHFHIDYSYSESVSASKSSDSVLCNCVGASFTGGFTGIASQGVTASNVGDSKQANKSNSGSVEGVTGNTTRTFMGATYSRAWTYNYSGSAGIGVLSDEHLSGVAAFNGSINITVGANQIPPTAVIAPPVPASPTIGTAVTLDGSQSHANTSGASITQYQWAIQNSSGGTDTLAGPTVQYTWTKAGTYPVTLTVTDSNGLTGTASTNVQIRSQAPTAVIAPPTPPNPSPGTAVLLDGSQSHANTSGATITQYQWAIQNSSGGTDTLAGPTVQYTWTKAGTYPVTLTVTDSNGLTGTASTNVQITNLPPTAVIAPPVPASPTIGTAVRLDGSQSHANTSGAAITQYQWAIQNSSGGTDTLAGPTVQYTWTKGGSYLVTLTVTDSKGLTGTASTNVQITQAEPTIGVAPASLDFGPVGLNDVRTKRILIRNIGPAGSVLNGTVQQPSAPFNITSGGGSFSLTSGQSWFVDVAFNPTSQGTFTDQVVITSNDPAMPTVSVPLDGEVVQSVKLWINAFIPSSIPGLTLTAPAPFAPSTVIRGPEPLYQLNGALYMTDQRSFSSDPSASARMHSEVWLDVTFGPLLQNEIERTDRTEEIGQLSPQPYSVACLKAADTSRMHFQNVRGSSDLIQIDIAAAANNPCTAPLSILPTPDISYTGTITIDVPARTISFNGFIDSFPAFEMYAAINNHPPLTLFMIPPPPGNDPWNLFGPANVPVNVSVPFSN